MKRFIILFSAINIFACCFPFGSSSRNGNPPTIRYNAEYDSHRYRTSHNITLPCSADYPITWKLPENSNFQDWSDPEAAKRVTINSTEEDTVISGEKKKRYKSVLGITNLQYTDTGNYTCVEKENSTQKPMETSNYIYVHDNNAGHVFLHWKPEFIQEIAMNETSYIRCLITNPGSNTNPTLFIDNVEQNQSGISYRNDSGFRIEANSLSSDLSGKEVKVRCKADVKGVNIQGSTEFTLRVIGSDKNNAQTVGLSALALIFIIIIFVVFSLVIVKKRRKKNTGAGSRDVEISRRCLTLHNEIGKGQFGKVCRATLGPKRRCIGKSPKGPIKDVAVKMPKNGKDPEHIKILHNELKVLTLLDYHPNVVNLLGAVTKRRHLGELFVVVEYCQLGSLQDYLWSNRRSFISDPNQGREFTEDSTTGNVRILTKSKLFSFAFQVANGMTSLSTKVVLHRDLAARNILLTDRGLAKICDFGLARNDQPEYVPQASRYTPMPMKWMAPEALGAGGRERRHSVKSDVWSFGVVLWEIFSLGRNPYEFESESESDSFEQVGYITHIEEGNRLEKPVHASDRIYSTMRICWEYLPENRPTFLALREQIGSELKSIYNQEWESLETLLQEEIRRHHDYVKWKNEQSASKPGSSLMNAYRRIIPPAQDSLIKAYETPV